MGVERIRELLKAAADTGAAEVEIEAGGIRIVVRQHAVSAVMPAPQPPVRLAPAMPVAGAHATNSPTLNPASPDVSPEPGTGTTTEEEEGTLIRALTPGTFYARPAPNKDPFVKVGDQVNVGDTLCILEAMKVMNEMESEVAGKVRKVLVADGDPVEYDQPLFVIDS